MKSSVTEIHRRAEKTNYGNVITVMATEIKLFVIENRVKFSVREETFPCTRNDSSAQIEPAQMASCHFVGRSAKFDREVGGGFIDSNEQILFELKSSVGSVGMFPESRETFCRTVTEPLNIGNLLSSTTSSFRSKTEERLIS